MESPKKQENGLNRSHFTKLHDKIHTKYMEVQKKLQKHTSFESLPDSDIQEKQSTGSDLSKSTSDLFNEMFKTECFPKSEFVKCELKFENVHTNLPKVININNSESVIFDFDESKITNKVTNNDTISSSLESISDSLSQVEAETQSIPSSPAKISIRDRIGSRIAHARERRRKISTEKNATKPKKKDKFEKFSLANCRSLTMSNYRRTKVGTVSVAIIEASGWNNDVFDEKQRQLMFRLRLGSDKPKSKIQKTLDTKAKWQETFNLSLYDDTLLEIVLSDRDILVGRTSINLTSLEKEKTYKMRIYLEGGELDVGNVQIFILLTISGTPGNNMDLSDMESSNLSVDPSEPEFQGPITLRPSDFHKIGWLYVTIYGAKGLPFGEHYCVLNLANNTRQTFTEQKTSDPTWMKSFYFVIRDVTENIIFTIYDEKNKEEVGKVSIPLLKINSGEKKTYALKDNFLRERAKGNNPRLLLQMKITWNVVKASIRVLNPREEIYMETDDKIDRHLFARNVTRAKLVYVSAMDIFRFWKSCFEWESITMNIIGLAIWIPFCWNFKIWMFPLLILAPFMWYKPESKWRKDSIASTGSSTTIHDNKESRPSLAQKISSLQDIIQNVQNAIGEFAKFGERIKNLYNFTEPFLTHLAIFGLLLISFVLYLIPTRYIFIIWGIHKFTRKMIRPNRIPNNEVLDLLSRVPDDEMILDSDLLDVAEEDFDNSSV